MQLGVFIPIGNNGWLISTTSPQYKPSFDLNKTVAETLTLLEHQLHQSRIKTAVALEPALPRIKGSPGKLQQVVLNLILNARDAMEEGGTLSIRSTHAEGTIRISIQDTGTGITQQNLPRIFDPFFTTKGAKKGTGLGLSVSYGIVREHGGEIVVRSEQGKGTTFELVFPEPGSALLPSLAREVAVESNSAQAVFHAQPVLSPQNDLPAGVPATAMAQSKPVIH